MKNFNFLIFTLSMLICSSVLCSDQLPEVKKIAWKPGDKVVGWENSQDKKAEHKPEKSISDSGDVEFHFHSPNWSGVSINWCQFQANSPNIVNIDDYKYLIITFQVKVNKGSESLLATLGDIDKGISPPVKVKTFCKDKKLPTEKTTIAIPLSEFKKEKRGKKLSSGKLCQITFSTFQYGGTNDIILTVYEIGFGN
jgi:hypothetical protein